MERKVWTKDEFLNKYDELRRQGLTEKEIKEKLDMNYMSMSNFRDLRDYYKHFSDNKNMNNIIKQLKRMIDENGVTYINREIYEAVDPFCCIIDTAVAVLINEGYEKWLVALGKEGEKKNTYRLLASPKYDTADILDFVKKTRQVADDYTQK